MRKTALSWLFGLTLFVSAALLFWSEPMVARLVLPLLGGTPAVWNTCLLFFQALLLAGYAYALFAATRFSLRQQSLVQLALLIVAAAVSLPIRLSADTAAGAVPREGDPTWWLLLNLLTIVGLPFFVLSTSGPLLQYWFSQSRHESARDPYFLYAASNAGSLIALLGYPLLLEPFFNLRQQSWLWALVYAALFLLIALCALVTAAFSGGASISPADAPAITPDHVQAFATPTTDLRHDSEVMANAGGALNQLSPAEPLERITNARRLRWTALAFVPSSLMLSATTYISTDIASLPLLWVIPLSIYLLTLIVAFARRRMISRRLVALLMPGATIVLVLVYLSGATQPALFLALLHLIYLFIASLSCHFQLADERPEARRLAEYYLWMSIGGALGGLFNALLAPALFDAVVEYPLAILLATLLRPALKPRRAESLAGPLKIATDDAFQFSRQPENEVAGFNRLDLLLPVVMGALTLALGWLAGRYLPQTLETLAMVLGFPLLTSYFWRRRRWRFALAVGAVMLASVFSASFKRQTLHAERNFFGVVRVTGDSSGDLHWLYNGSTIHGRQFTALGRQCEPISYYHRLGPLGRVFEAYQARPASPAVAVVGLGTGATVAYSRPGEHWTFYEINPVVLEVARDPRYFTYLSNCANAPADVVLGDARLRLRDAPDKGYGLIVLDAFSSDAIPVHLMTQEALDLYLSKLADGGLLALHISNRSLDLHPIVADLARSRQLICLVFADNAPNQPDGKEPSLWTVLARRAADVEALTQDAHWRPLEGQPGRQVWTDDFSNIVGVLKW